MEPLSLTLLPFLAWIPGATSETIARTDPVAVVQEGEDAGAPAASALHPEDADFFFVAPDVPRLLEAMRAAPLARMLREDEKARSAFAQLLGLEPQKLSGTDVVRWGLTWFAGTERRAGALLDLCDRIARVSLSMRSTRREEGWKLVDFGGLRGLSSNTAGAFDDVRLLLVVELADEESARALFAEVGCGSAEAEEPVHHRVEPFGEIWVWRRGKVLAAGTAAVRPERWAALQDGGEPSLENVPPPELPLPGAPGAVVLEGWQRAQAWRDLAPEVPPLAALLLARLLGSTWGDLGELRWRATAEGGFYRLVSVAREPDHGLEVPVAEAAIPASLLQAARPDGFLVFATTLDGPRLSRSLEAAGDSRPIALGPLVERLGPGALLSIEAAAGAMATPPTLLIVDLREPEGFLDALEEALAPLAEELPELRLRSSRYRGVPYLSLAYQIHGLDPMMTMALPRPAIAVLGERLVVASSTLSLKAEIRRAEAGGEGEAAEGEDGTSAPWIEGGFPTDGAISFVSLDWGRQIGALLDAARAMGPLLSQFGAEIPFDLASIPKGEVVARHLRPTLHRVVRVDDALVTRHRTAIGPEAWLGLAGIVRRMVGRVEVEAGVESSQLIAVPVSGDATAAERTRLTHLGLEEARTAIAVFQLQKGRLPESLEELLEPTDAFPDGFLQEVPRDAWGRPLRYRVNAEAYELWSVGPDGEDQAGAGDDVTLP